MIQMNGETALIVEDDPEWREAMTEQATRMGLEVISACDYHSAVVQLGSARPVLACIDLELPNEPGYELCEYIRSKPRLARTRILVTSARALIEDIAYAEQAGANAFLKKPFSMQQFGDYVTMLLSRDRISTISMQRLQI